MGAGYTPEGTVFLVPLEDGRFAPGVLARAHRGDGIGYFFPTVDRPPSEMPDLDPFDTIWIERFGTPLGLDAGAWPILGLVPDWSAKRHLWPVPTFGWVEGLTGRCFLVRYPDDDPDASRTTIPCTSEEVERFPPDGSAGAGYVVIVLTNMGLPDEELPPTSPALEAKRTDWRFVVQEAQARLAAGDVPAPGPEPSREGLEHSVICRLVPPVRSEVFALEDRLNEAIEGHGMLDGNEVGPDGVSFYLYGPDAQGLFDAAEPVLRGQGSPGSHATLRFGEPDDPDAAEVRVELK